jgi:hypothetical protein
MTSHCLHGNSIPQIGCHYFCSGLKALLKNSLAMYLHIESFEMRFEFLKYIWGGLFKIKILLLVTTFSAARFFYQFESFSSAILFRAESSSTTCYSRNN